MVRKLASVIQASLEGMEEFFWKVWAAFVHAVCALFC